MSSDVYNRLSFLKSQIERHNKLYHGHDDPVISDKEFDNICIEYDNLVVRNANLGFKKREDIGFEPLEKFTKIKHSKPMLSLNNGFNMNDIEDFIKRTLKFLKICLLCPSYENERFLIVIILLFRLFSRV